MIPYLILDYNLNIEIPRILISLNNNFKISCIIYMRHMTIYCNIIPSLFYTKPSFACVIEIICIIILFKNSIETFELIIYLLTLTNKY